MCGEKQAYRDPQQKAPPPKGPEELYKEALDMKKRVEMQFILDYIR